MSVEDSVKWKFRPPPRGVARENLRECSVTRAGDTCSLGDHCDEAHCLEELQEWRIRWGEMHRIGDKQKTYSEKILDELLEKASSSSMSSCLPGVSVTCDQETNVRFNVRNSDTVWNFEIKSDRMLQGVSLLGVECLENFSICDVTLVRMKENLVLDSKPGECVIDEEQKLEFLASGKAGFSYTLKIKFHTSIFGTFKQTVVFDFGERPLLSKTLIADVVPFSADSELQSIKESILQTSDPWDAGAGASSDIVSFDPPLAKVHADEDKLLSQYPSPQPSTFKMSDGVTQSNLTRENYKERLHQLLFIEEMSQYQALDGFHAAIEVQLTINYLVSATPSNASTAKYARPGELFGRMELSAELSEDSAAGRLILTKCSSILLKFKVATTESKKKKIKFKRYRNKKIYECLIEDTLKSAVYIRLSSKMVEENKLSPDMKLRAYIQFRLNRNSMTEMHWAVDNLGNVSTVYPDISSVPNIPWSPATEWPTHQLDTRLNPKQKEAIRAITAPPTLNLPPILIIGPYGTGKTFTLGKAIEQLLSEDGTRILVCTHSNSAADLYIKEYLDPAFESEKIANKKLVRVYYHNRWVQTVHESVLKYCLIETDPLTSTRSFRSPVLEDLQNADIVVATLSTSRCVAQLLNPGHFTHILLDEAAQALETEAIMPLVLAEQGTRVVLAGDHMQLEPNITSDFAKEKKLGVSLLERLYYLYPVDFPCKIMLVENYRSHEAIVDYTSDMFYQQKLVASGKQPAHSAWYPLTFFTARGEDIQESASTSYYNNSEVAEIVDRLAELRRNWPKQWGKKEEAEIGVVTPYHDQVQMIRGELRKKKLYNISVERVLNVQGKQYRAIFISTVRTRKTCNKTDSNQMTTLDFGFLSSAKLLNTAITRAQSLVAVVGDPVTLVSVGKCRKLWESFLQICADKKSFHGFNHELLKSHLEAIELKKIYGLNPLAPEFVPKFEVWHPSQPSSSSNEGSSKAEVPPPQVPPQPSPHMIPPRMFSPLPPAPTFPYLHPVMLQYYASLQRQGQSHLIRPPPYPLPGGWCPPEMMTRPMFPPCNIPPPAGIYPGLPPMTLPPIPFSGPPAHPVHPLGIIPGITPLDFPPLPAPEQATNTPPPPTAPETTESLLPSSVSLAQMRLDPILAEAWFKHLQTSGLNAEGFRQLLTGGLQELPPLTSAQVKQNGGEIQKFTTNTTNNILNEGPATARTPDSGCVSSPPASDATMTMGPPLGYLSAVDGARESLDADFIQSILGDLDPLDGTSISPAPDNVPLYMRGAGPGPGPDMEQLHQETTELLSLQDKLASLSAEFEDRFGGEDEEINQIQLSKPDKSAATSTGSVMSSSSSLMNQFPQLSSGSLLNSGSVQHQTYAGVLRSQVRHSESDPLRNLRNLGTRGSQVPFL